MARFGSAGVFLQMYVLAGNNDFLEYLSAGSLKSSKLNKQDIAHIAAICVSDLYATLR